MTDTTVFNRSYYPPLSTYPTMNISIPASTQVTSHQTLGVNSYTPASFHNCISYFSSLFLVLVEQGYLIILSFVCSLVRNTLYSSSKLKSLDILLALAEHLSDDVKLDRLIPYVMALLTDESALVRSNALKVLTQVVSVYKPKRIRWFPFNPPISRSYALWNLSLQSTLESSQNTSFHRSGNSPQILMSWLELLMPAV